MKTIKLYRYLKVQNIEYLFYKVLHSTEIQRLSQTFQYHQKLIVFV